MYKRGITLLSTLLSTILSATAGAVDKPPSLTGLYPPGSHRGKTVTVSVYGELPGWPLNSWISDSREEQTSLACKALEAKGKLEITVPANASPGIYWLRLFNKAGASSPRPFLVSELPDTLEAEPNNAVKDAPLLEKTGVMVYGQLEKKGDVDSYAVELQADEILVADLLANRTLASPMDGSLQIASSAGFVLAENDDDQGMDPRIVFRAPAKGRYIIRVFSFPSKPNSSIQFAGAEAYIYRLALTTGPFIEHTYPLAANLSEHSEVNIRGWNIPEDKSTVKLQAAVTRGRQLLRVPGATNAARIQIGDLLSLTEEQYRASGKLPELKKELFVSGLIGSTGESDSFTLASASKESLEVSVSARAIGSLLDPVISIRDSASKTVSEKDDSDGGLDCSTSFTPAENKTYHIEVSDRFGHGGRRFYYLLRIGRPVRGFSLKLGSDNFVLEKGKKLEVPVTVERHGGYDGKIIVTALGLPDGVRATPVESLNGKDSAKAVKLVLEGDINPTGAPFRIQGRVEAQTAPPGWAGYDVPGQQDRLTRAWLTVKGG